MKVEPGLHYKAPFQEIPKSITISRDGASAKTQQVRLDVSYFFLIADSHVLVKLTVVLL